MNYLLIIIALYVLYYILIILLDLSKNRSDVQATDAVLMDFKPTSVPQEITDDEIASADDPQSLNHDDTFITPDEDIEKKKLSPKVKQRRMKMRPKF